MRTIQDIDPRQPEDEGKIDITPMLDVVFILLIFFIVTASFIKETGIDLKRQGIESTGTESDNILIAIDADDGVWINRRQVDVRQVRPNIERLKAENLAGHVVIEADEDSRNEVLVQVMDASRSAGVYDIVIVAAN